MTELEVTLSQAPYTTVAYSISISDGTEAMIESSSFLTFTKANYDVPQYILVRGLMDSDSANTTFEVGLDPIPLEKIQYYEQFVSSSITITNMDSSTVSNGLSITSVGEKSFTTEAGGGH